MLDLKEAELTSKEKKALQASLRRSKKIVRDIPARDLLQAPPYVLLPLMPLIPNDWIVWNSSADKYGFIGETIRGMNGNYVIETGITLDGLEYLTAPSKGDVEIAIPRPSISYEWLERAYDNRKPFALLMPFDTWMTDAQQLFQRKGISVIIFNRPVSFLDQSGKKGRAKNFAWFTWSLPFTKQQVTYGYIPLEKELPRWLVRPNHKHEITQGAKSMEDRLAIRHATNPVMWPVPTKGGSTAKKE